MQSPLFAPPCPTQKHHGFTLIELMVVVTLLGVLLGLAAPSFTNAIRQRRLDAVAQELIGSITLARTEALRTGQQVVIRRTEPCAANTSAHQWGCGWRVFIDLDNDEQIDANETVVQVSNPNAHVHVLHKGLASIGPQVTISRHGGLPVGMSLVVYPAGTDPKLAEQTVQLCNWGYRVRTATEQHPCND